MVVPPEAEAEAECVTLKQSHSGPDSRHLSIKRCQFRHRYREDLSASDTFEGHGKIIMARRRLMHIH